MAKEKNHHHKLERGQSFTEMALSFVFFLFFVMGMLDLGRLYFLFVALEDSAGEAALFLALNANCPDEPGSEMCTTMMTEGDCPEHCIDPNNARDRAEKASGLIDMDKEDADLSYELLPATETSEYMVRVILEYPFDLLTPVVADLVGSGTVKLRAEATQVLLSYE